MKLYDLENNYAEAIICFSAINGMICLCFFNFMDKNTFLDGQFPCENNNLKPYV